MAFDVVRNSLEVFGHNMPVCFIGGPYSKPNPWQNVLESGRIVDRLWLDKRVFPICPMIEAHLQDSICARGYEEWLLRTQRYIPLCNVGLFRPGESTGKDQEIQIFRLKGIPMFEGDDVEKSIDKLYEWVKSVWNQR